MGCDVGGYYSGSGFVVYWDFVMAFPLRVTSYTLIYALFDGSQPRSKPTLIKVQQQQQQQPQQQQQQQSPFDTTTAVVPAGMHMPYQSIPSSTHVIVASVHLRMCIDATFT